MLRRDKGGGCVLLYHQLNVCDFNRGGIGAFCRFDYNRDRFVCLKLFCVGAVRGHTFATNCGRATIQGQCVVEGQNRCRRFIIRQHHCGGAGAAATARRACNRAVDGGAGGGPCTRAIGCHGQAIDGASVNGNVCRMDLQGDKSIRCHGQQQCQGKHHRKGTFQNFFNHVSFSFHLFSPFGTARHKWQGQDKRK